MFKIQFYVDDRKLGEVFKRLAGLALNLEHAYVPNAEPKPNGHIVSMGGALDLFMDEVRKRNFTTFTAKEAKEIVLSMGKSESSYSYYLAKIVKAGQLRQKGMGTQTTYIVKGQ